MNLDGWGRRVNMMWLETPAGVGASWAQGVENMELSDEEMVMDIIEAIEEFFEGYSEYVG